MKAYGYENPKYSVFLSVAKQLNDCGIVPVLMGSLGLEIVTTKNWDVGDIDIHIPGDSRGWSAPVEEIIYQWEEVKKQLEGLGFSLVDLHEHAFEKGTLRVEFAVIDTLPEFAGIALDDIKQIEDQGIRYRLLNATQYYQLYQASSKDSYRNQKNNQKDFAKIAYLAEHLK